jgi:hypothetical protein
MTEVSHQGQKAIRKFLKKNLHSSGDMLHFNQIHSFAELVRPGGTSCGHTAKAAWPQLFMGGT